MRYLIPIIVLLSVAACDSKPKPRVKPDFTYLRCSGLIGFPPYDVILLQLGKVGENYVSTGPDVEYDSQSYYFDSGFSELANRKLPTTKKEYDSEMSRLDRYAEDMNGAIGRIRVTDTSLYFPSSGGYEIRLDREDLRIYSGISYNGPTFQCKKTNRNKLRGELQSMRVKYSVYKRRMEAANPGDTRKI